MNQNKVKHLRSKKQSKSFYSKDGDGTKWETLQAKKKRVMNYKLIHVSGIPIALATNKCLTSKQYFGKYGTIESFFLSDKDQGSSDTHQSCSVYIGYQTQLSAALALLGSHNIEYKGYKILAIFGTNRYCLSFLNGQKCQKDKCFFLHYLDSQNQAHKIEHSKQRHLQRAFSTVIKNIGKIIGMEQDDVKESTSIVRSIHMILQKLIKKGLLTNQQYEKIKKKGKVACEKVVMIRKTPNQLAISTNLSESVNLGKVNKKQAQFNKRMASSMTVNLKQKMQVFPSLALTSSSTTQFSAQSSGSYLEQLIADKILNEFKKKRRTSKLQFASNSQNNSLQYPKQDEKAKKMREIIMQVLLSS